MQAGRAATALLLRDGASDLEVLLLERRPDSGFVPGAFVFPGGGVDAGDDDPALVAIADGPDDREASRQFGLTAGGFAYRVAAIRETFEEAGVLLATRSAETECVSRDFVSGLGAERHRLDCGDTDLVALCAEHGLTLSTRRLRSFAHWITPMGAPRRYDARFFVAAAPDHDASHDGTETVSSVWLSPRDALELSSRGRLPLILPTERCLHALRSFQTVGDVLASVDETLADPEGPAYVADRGGFRLALTPDERRAGMVLAPVSSGAGTGHLARSEGSAA